MPTRRALVRSAIDRFLAATVIDNLMLLGIRNVKGVHHNGTAMFNPWEDDPASFVLA